MSVSGVDLTVRIGGSVIEVVFGIGAVWVDHRVEVGGAGRHIGGGERVDRWRHRQGVKRLRCSNAALYSKLYPNHAHVVGCVSFKAANHGRYIVINKAAPDINR